MRQLLILLSLAASAAARPTSVTPEMDRLLLAGVDAIYRMDFAAADAICREAIALDPGYPHGYLGLATVDLIRYSYGAEQSDPALLDSFEAKVKTTIEVAEARLASSPKDADVLFVLGAAHGASGRMAIVRRQWLKAFRHGSASMKSVRLAAKLAPELHDARLGLGMFDYYVATIPKFAGWLAKIVLGGDRERGIELVRIAAEKGHYAKTAAQLILVEIFLEDRYGARNPPEALRHMRAIAAKYPDSAMLHSALIVALHENERYDEAIAQAREFQARVRSGKYPPQIIAMSHALLGTALWGAGEKAQALAEFEAGAEAKAAGRMRWPVWNRFRAGQLLDHLGRRADALAAYRAAYAEKDDWEYRALIKPCLKNPCVGSNYPGRFSLY